MDKLKGLFGGGELPGDLQSLFPDGLPDVSAVKTTLAGKSSSEIGTAVSAGLKDVDPANMSEFGTVIADYQVKAGHSATEGLAAGNPTVVGDTLTKALAGGGGLDGMLEMLSSATGGGGMLDSVMDTVSGGNSDLVNLLKNPKIAGVLAPVLASVIKMGK